MENINEDIKAFRIMLIDEEGKSLGEFVKTDAIELAYSRDMDLVQVSDEAKPFCKIMDYAKFSYERKKQQKKNRGASSANKLKEVRFKLVTAENDLLTLAKRARSFISDGNKVKITLSFRGREGQHYGLIRDTMYQFYDRLADIAKIESDIRRNDNSIFIIISP